MVPFSGQFFNRFRLFFSQFLIRFCLWRSKKWPSRIRFRCEPQKSADSASEMQPPDAITVLKRSILPTLSIAVIPAPRKPFFPSLTTSPLAVVKAMNTHFPPYLIDRLHREHCHFPTSKWHLNPRQSQTKSRLPASKIYGDILIDDTWLVFNKLNFKQLWHGIRIWQRRWSYSG